MTDPGHDEAHDARESAGREGAGDETAAHHPVPRSGGGRVVVISGPSGVGKDTVLGRVFERRPELRYSVSYTTRPPRSGERHDVSYSFVDATTFDEMIARGEFLEWATVHGHRYGTSRRRVLEAVAGGDDIVLNVDVQGAEAVRDRLPPERVILIFLEPPSPQELRRRLEERDTEDTTSLDARMSVADRELAAARHYDHRVVNDDVDRAAGELLAILDGRGWTGG